MSTLKIQHMKDGRVIFDSENEPEPQFMGALGDYSITFRPSAVPSCAPSPSVVLDIPRISDEEAEAWYQRTHGVMNGEGHEDDDFEDDEETEDDEDCEDE